MSIYSRLANRACLNQSHRTASNSAGPGVIRVFMLRSAAGGGARVLMLARARSDDAIALQSLKLGGVHSEKFT